YRAGPMDAPRTPDDRSADRPAFPWEPSYVALAAGDGSDTKVRLAYLDVGPTSTEVASETVLLLHGEPSWSYLYRHMVPVLVDAGLRVVAPDLVGFGRSDKPMQQSDYTYARHIAWASSLVFDALDLRGVTFFGQDWGGLIGLRL